jgi:dienelactone hydrolase
MASLRCAVAACAVLLFAQPLYSRASELVPDIVRIPLDGADALGADVRMMTGIFRPPGDGPFPVLVYSHGRSSTEAERRNTRLPDGHSSYLRYWLKRGFVVVAPIRPGYGETGGPDREASGVRYDVFGNCWGWPDFDRSASAAATALHTVIGWIYQQPWADSKRIVLAGTSMGGLASIATAATNPDGIAATINFAGGTGGSGARSPQHSCGSDAIRALMSRYGKTTRVPSLWLYAENDSFWGADWPRAWHRAFANGGSRTRFVLTEAVPHADGHQLFARGTALWKRDVDGFLDENGFVMPDAH